MILTEDVNLIRMRAGVIPFSSGGQWDLLSVFTHPAHLLGGHAHHQGIGLNIFINYRAGPDKSKFTNSDATHYGAVRAERGALFDQSVTVLVFALNQRTRVIDVGEDHAGAAEDSFFERYVVVNRDVVLDFAVVADDDLVADEDVLAERYALADFGAAANVGPVPDATAFPDLCAFVNDGSGMDSDVGHGFSINGKADFVG